MATGDLGATVNPEMLSVLGNAQDPRFSPGLKAIATDVENNPSLAFGLIRQASPHGATGPSLFREGFDEQFFPQQSQYLSDLARGRTKDTAGADFLAQLQRNLMAPIDPSLV